ncbi:hypothetical protein GYH30_054438 [Glycine max]|uniref:anthranilate synthase n=1 Tax=Glycine max TaxID=3847 RepID=A0A0R0EDM9_SOYBN|nr:hypothetical protein GYH30_054438 [Glycine max]
MASFFLLGEVLMTVTFKPRAFANLTARWPSPPRPTTPKCMSGGGSVAKRVIGFVAKATLNSVEGILANNKSNNNPIAVIDNHDSFTCNLCPVQQRHPKGPLKNRFIRGWITQLYKHLSSLLNIRCGTILNIYGNDELTVEELKSKNSSGVLISPGPGEPQDSGISLQTVLELGPTVPLFGVCMGLQCIGEAFGGENISPFLAGRYHSLVIEKDNFPNDELEVTAWTEDGLIMAARHKKYKHPQGVQFHPESLITPEG